MADLVVGTEVNCRGTVTDTSLSDLFVEFDGIHDATWILKSLITPVPETLTPVDPATLRKGDRVELAGVEGCVASPHEDGYVVVTWDDGISNYLNGVLLTKLRLIAPVEPEYEIGDAYIDANGLRVERYKRDDGTLCWRTFGGLTVEHDWPVRPLRRLIPEETT